MVDYASLARLTRNDYFIQNLLSEQNNFLSLYHAVEVSFYFWAVQTLAVEFRKKHSNGYAYVDLYSVLGKKGWSEGGVIKKCCRHYVHLQKL